jgi:hypothetical protein
VNCILLLMTLMLFNIKVSPGLSLNKIGLTSWDLPSLLVGLNWLLLNMVFSIDNSPALSMNPLIFKSFKLVYWFEVISNV